MRTFSNAVICFFCALSAVIQADVPPKQVGVVWEGTSSMQTRLMEGFMAAMRPKADKIKVTVAGELPSLKAATAQFKKFEKTMDAVVFLRSTGCAFFKNHNPSKPCFFGGCNDPKLLGAVKSFANKGGKVTGVTYALPYNYHFNTFNRVFPKAKSICLLVEKGHPSSPIDIAGTRKECAKRGITMSVIQADNAESLLKNVKRTAPKVDYFVIGQQALIIDHAKAIIAAAGDTPVASFIRESVIDGAVCATAVNDQKMGVMLAESVIDALLNGKSVGEMPVKTDPAPTLILNTQALKKHEILVPIDLLKQATIIK